jgi:hypothetical protein
MAVVYKRSYKVRVFVTDGPFQLSIMFASSATAYLSEASARSFSLGKLGLVHKHLTRPERHAKKKRSSLLGKFVNYSFKSFVKLIISYR